MTAYGDLMSEYWFAQGGREMVRPYFFQENDRLPQYQTEGVLRARVKGFPTVSKLFGLVGGDH